MALGGFEVLAEEFIGEAEEGLVEEEVGVGFDFGCAELCHVFDRDDGRWSVWERVSKAEREVSRSGGYSLIPLSSSFEGLSSTLSLKRWKETGDVDSLFDQTHLIWQSGVRDVGW